MADNPKVSNRIRDQLDHPVIDSDGHFIESQPLLRSYIEEVAGGSMVDRYDRELAVRPLSSTGNVEWAEATGAIWGYPTNAHDLATAMVPRLFHERLDELGLDFVVAFPSFGLALATIQDPDVRRAVVRAENTMSAEMFAPYRARIAPAACIPMHTPDEAIDELRYCVGELHHRAAFIPPGVARPIPALERIAPEAFPAACRMDRYALDNDYDYDAVWREFDLLGIAVMSHGGVGLRYLPAGRRSPTNYSYNHMGGFAYHQIDLARALLVGGVPHRFPMVPFGFLEGGAGWACDLLSTLQEHWEKRNADALAEFLDPCLIDTALFERLVAEYRDDVFGRITEPLAPPTTVAAAANDDGPTEERHDFARSGIREEHDIALRFDRSFFFGCEADDISVLRAFDTSRNAFGSRLKAIFSSDVGHWDVRSMADVLASSYKFVEDGKLTAEQFKAFVFDHPVELWGNPGFFDGTPVEAYLTALGPGCC